jgi:hypothetical protein
MSWYDPLMTTLLTSPLHSLLSAGMVVLEIMGRKSGRLFRLPVSYTDMGDGLLITSLSERVWWRNLRGGAQVGVILRGQRLAGRAEAIEEPSQVASLIATLLKHKPGMARYYRVRLGPGLVPVNPVELKQAARGKVIITINGLNPVRD